MTASSSTAASMENFHANMKPTDSRRAGLRASIGRPARSVPDGQIYSQNHGSPRPVASLTRAGRSSTMTISTIYLSFTSPLCPGMFFFLKGNGILPSRSCTKPNGHIQPHTKRPKRAPTIMRKPNT